MSETVSDVSVIGLGAMGAKLAITFLERGLSVTVWNRNKARAEHVVAKGAVLAGSPAKAIEASATTVICLLDCDAVKSVLAGAASSVKDRAIANLTSGSAEDAMEIAGWAKECGAGYLHGGIICYPRDIGSEAAVIVYSGDAAAFEKNRQLLDLLAGDQRFLGNSPATASTLFAALSNFWFTAVGGFFESAALANTGGIDPAGFASLAEEIAIPILKGSMADAVARIQNKDYSGEQATIDTHIDGFEMTIGMLETAGLPSLMINSFNTYLKGASSEGWGLNDVASLYGYLSKSTR